MPGTPDQIKAAEKAMALSDLAVQAEQIRIEDKHTALQAAYNAFYEANRSILEQKAAFGAQMRQLKAPLVALREKHIANVKAYEMFTGQTTEATLTTGKA